MSSILDALKKLEKEKIHRDEVSTAIASDILRSSGKVRAPQWKLPLTIFILVVIAAVVATFLLREPDKTSTINISNTPAVPNIEMVKPEPVQVATVTAPINTLPTDLPLLSGIVFQQHKDARMAIINDLPVMEGTVIAGYTLQEIFPDYVVLTYKGQSFSLPLNP